MEIPDPVAYPEEKVMVRNYRMRPAAWEEGTVRSFSFVPAHFITRYDGSLHEVKHHWSYDVRIERPVIKGVGRYGRPKGGGYTLSVGDDWIRVLPKGSWEKRK